MSRLVAFAAIQGAYNIVQKAEGKLKEALEKIHRARNKTVVLTVRRLASMTRG